MSVGAATFTTEGLVATIRDSTWNRALDLESGCEDERTSFVAAVSLSPGKSLLRRSVEEAHHGRSGTARRHGQRAPRGG